MYYLGIFSVRGRARVAAFATVEEAWRAAIVRPLGGSRALASRDVAMDWLREGASLARAEMLLRAVESRVRRDRARKFRASNT